MTEPTLLNMMKKSKLLRALPRSRSPLRSLPPLCIWAFVSDPLSAARSMPSRAVLSGLRHGRALADVFHGRFAGSVFS